MAAAQSGSWSGLHLALPPTLSSTATSNQAADHGFNFQVSTRKETHITVNVSRTKVRDTWIKVSMTRVFEGCLSSAAAVQRTPCGRSSRSITRQIFKGPHFSRTAGRKNMQLICQRKMWNLTWWFWETKEYNFII